MRLSATIARAARLTLTQRVSPMAAPALRATSAFHAQAAPTSTRPFSSTSTLLKKGGKDKGGKADKGGKGGKKSKKDDADEDGAEADGLTREEIDALLKKTRSKMDKSADWARTTVFDGVERGRGRVMPALLDNVKVAIPDQGSVPLKSVASITVRQSSLWVEVWDGPTMKHVESAIHKANLPGMSPQRDGNALKIPVSRPTGEVRTAILKSLHETIEMAKNQIRTARQEGLKALGGRGEEGADEVQKMTDELVHDIEKLFVNAKKEFEKA